MRSILAFLLSAVSFARDETSGPQALVRGHVVVTKHLSSSDGYYVEGREMTVTFNATNVGKECVAARMTGRVPSSPSPLPPPPTVASPHHRPSFPTPQVRVQYHRV